MRTYVSTYVHTDIRYMHAYITHSTCRHTDIQTDILIDALQYNTWVIWATSMYTCIYTAYFILESLCKIHTCTNRRHYVVRVWLHSIWYGCHLHGIGMSLFSARRCYGFTKGSSQEGSIRNTSCKLDNEMPGPMGNAHGLIWDNGTWRWVIRHLVWIKKTM